MAYYCGVHLLDWDRKSMGNNIGMIHAMGSWSMSGDYVWLSVM
jgi:hypothetical protein